MNHQGNPKLKSLNFQKKLIYLLYLKNKKDSETKINYWFKNLLNCNISAILVAIIKLINISKEKQIGFSKENEFSLEINKKDSLQNRCS